MSKLELGFIGAYVSRYGGILSDFGDFHIFYGVELDPQPINSINFDAMGLIQILIV